MASTDSGLSLLEALAATAVLVAVCGASFRSTAGAVGAFTEAGRLVREDAKIMQVSVLLRSALWRVRPPIASERRLVDRRSDGLRFYFLDGRPDRYVEVRWTPHSLSVSNGLSISHVAGLAAVSLSLIEQSGAPPAVEVRMASGRDSTVSIVAAVGSWTLVGDGGVGGTVTGGLGFRVDHGALRLGLGRRGRSDYGGA